MRDAIVEAMRDAIWKVAGPTRMGQSREIAEAALSALEATGATVGVWQDIATAPRDGTRIIAAVNSAVCIAAWEGGIAEAWVITDSDGDGIVVHPTHWLPLPAAPLAASPMRGEG